MNLLPSTCLDLIRANLPLAGVSEEIIRVLEALLFFSVRFEREEATASPHKTRTKRGFKGRSNPDGTKPYTKDSTGQTKVNVARKAREQGVRFWGKAAKAIRDATYTPEPFRLVTIPKHAEDGSIKGYREIGVPTYIDRVVIEAIRQVLERRLDPYLPKGAHGYRASKVDGSLAPYTWHEGTSRGDIKSVALSIAKGAHSGFPFLVEGDVVSAFTHLSRQILRRLLENAGMTDERFINMIIRCLGTHLVGEDGQIKQVEGIAMGSPISPLIWTLYSTGLHAVLPPKGERTEMDVLVHSYADNFWIQGSSAEAVHRAMRQMDRQANRLDLTFKWDSGGVVDLRTLEGDSEGYRVLKQNKIQVRRMDMTGRLRFEVSESQTGSPTKGKKVSPTERKGTHRMGHMTPVTETIKGRPVPAPATREQETGEPEMGSPTGVGAQPITATREEGPDGPSGRRAGEMGSAINQSKDFGNKALIQPSSSEASDLSSPTGKDISVGGEDGCLGLSEEDSYGVGIEGGDVSTLSLTHTHTELSSGVSGHEGSIQKDSSLGVHQDHVEGPNRFRDALPPSSDLRCSSPFLSGEDAPRDGGYRVTPVDIIAVPYRVRHRHERGNDEGSVDLVPLHLDPTLPVARLRAVWRSQSARWRKHKVNRVRLEIPLSEVSKVFQVVGLFGHPDDRRPDFSRQGDDHWIRRGSKIDTTRGVLVLDLASPPVKRDHPKPSRMLGWHVVVGKAVGREGSKEVHVRVVRVRDLRKALHASVAALLPDDCYDEITDKMSFKAGGVEPPTARVRALNKALGKIPNDGQPLHLWGVPKGLLPPSGGRRWNVRPVALHDPVKAVQKALAARRGKVILHPADRLSHVFRAAWAMGALRGQAVV